MKTADLCDQYANQLQVLEPRLVDFGGHVEFDGPIATVKVYQDNALVRQALEEPGHGRILVVDGGGSLRCALVGDRLAALATENGWVGLIVYGCIRDSREISRIPIGVKALNRNPLKSGKTGRGDRDIPVSFGHVDFRPGAHLYADEDGVVVADRPFAMGE